MNSTPTALAHKGAVGNRVSAITRRLDALDVSQLTDGQKRRLSNALSAAVRELEPIR